jgi:hypothetical protein
MLCASTLIKKRFELRFEPPRESLLGAGNEIRTRDFNLGKVALYH